MADQVDDKPNSATEKDKPKFDWVTGRSACSLPKVFAVLRQQVEQDVKTRNSLRPQNAPYEFSVTVDTEAFTVFLKSQELQRSVTFKLGEHEISVLDDKNNSLFQVTVAFNDSGECRLHVNEEDREFWQVRRMALEDLMFRRE
jgi:hypothetical protein